MVKRQVFGKARDILKDSSDQIVAEAIWEYYQSLGIETSGVVLIALTRHGIELQYFGSQVRDDVDVENAVLWAAGLIKQSRT